MGGTTQLSQTRAPNRRVESWAPRVGAGPLYGPPHQALDDPTPAVAHWNLHPVERTLGVTSLLDEYKRLLSRVHPGILWAEKTGELSSGPYAHFFVGGEDDGWTLPDRVPTATLDH